MKSTNFNLMRYDADEGKVFDWAEPHYREDLDENGEIIKVQEHLNVKTLFIGANDAIENYIEVADDGTATALVTPDFATEADYQEALAELGVK